MHRLDLQRLQETRRRTLEVCRPLSQVQMDFSPSPGRWSVGEILDHLLLSEGIYRREMQQLIRLARAGQPARIRRSFGEIDVGVAFIPKVMLPFLELPLTVANIFMPRETREWLIRNRTIPAQNPVIATPRKSRPAPQMIRELQDALDSMVSLVEENADLDYGQMLLSHPALGDNDFCQIIRLIWSHEERHQEQIAEVMASPGFPA